MITSEIATSAIADTVEPATFVERVRVYPSGEIEIDMRTSSGFAFVTAS